MKKLKYTIGIIFLITSSHLLAQTKRVDSTFFEKVDTISGFYKIIFNSNTTNAVINKIKYVNALSDDDVFIEYRVNNDEFGNSHKKYQHYRNNIPVYGSQVILHSNNENIYSANGKIINNFEPSSQVNISVDEAIQLATKKIGSKIYMWQDSILDSAARYYPKPELLYYPNGNNYVLAYKMLIFSSLPFGKDYVIINVGDGEIINTHSAITPCLPKLEKNNYFKNISKLSNTAFDVNSCSGSCLNASGTALYYGNQSIIAGKERFNLDCKYRLIYNCYSSIIHTMSRINISFNSHSSDGYEYTSQNSTFSFAVLDPGVCAHWGLTMSDEFYRGYFGRNGFSGSGGTLNAFCNSNSIGSDNAYYDKTNDELNFGSGGDYLAHNDIVSLDIVGHEFTHGVSQYEANFDTYGEPGALNESFSDIFGTMIEYYAKSNHSTGVSFDYDYGNEPYYHMTYSIPNGPTIYTNRNMSNPNSSLLPDTYNGQYFWSPASTNVDAGGRHINCTIQDYWFYLLAEGGSGTNDIGNNYCVQGIGKDKAMRITYQNLTNYMGTLSDFASARAGAIQSAIDLYGVSSNEVAQVTAAWYAVGVGSNYNGNILVQNHTATGVENYNFNNRVNVVNFTANSGSNVTITSNTEIAILPNLSANQGSLFSAYITPACAGGVRLANPSNELKNYSTNSTIINEDDNSNRVDSNSTANELNVFPNPNNGEFKLTLNNNIELPKSIVIRDILGREIKTISNPISYEHIFDLKNMNEGLYVINVFYSDRTISKRIIKN